VKGPAISLRCDCGSEGSAAYGECWRCPACGRSYDTSQIPDGDYEQIVQLSRRYRVAGFAVVSVLAVLILVVALTGQPISIFAGLATAMLSWFLFIKPVVHRRHRRAVGNLTRRWELKAE
jgi:hypothetical protein